MRRPQRAQEAESREAAEYELATAVGVDSLPPRAGRAPGQAQALAAREVGPDSQLQFWRGPRRRRWKPDLSWLPSPAEAEREPSLSVRAPGSDTRDGEEFRCTEDFQDCRQAPS